MLTIDNRDKVGPVDAGRDFRTRHAQLQGVPRLPIQDRAALGQHRGAARERPIAVLANRETITGKRRRILGHTRHAAVERGRAAALDPGVDAHRVVRPSH